MHWMTFALISTALMGVASVIDSHLLSKRLPSMRAFLLPVALIHLPVALFFFYTNPLPAGVSYQPIVYAIAAGLVRSGAVLLMLYTLKSEEVSRVIPIIYTYPIMVAVMAIWVFDESLSYLQWLAILIVVSGTMMISFEKNPAAGKNMGKSLFRMFVSALLWAISDILRKKALMTGFSPWNAFCLYEFCMIAVFLAVALRPVIIRQWLNYKERKAAIGYVLLDETVSLVGIALQFWALNTGPVSLVSTVIGSRPVFVAVYSFLLGLFLPNFLIHTSNRLLMLTRIAATILIVVGINMINLTK
ncbi:MAG: EamA family transporter [Dehalococcoidales bacterium]|nr:EamA family transporter [Dehalococcoidales bacterium]